TTVGSPIHDKATVTGGTNPTGTVTFQLFGPGDTTCAGPNLVSGPNFVNVPLSGLSATSGDFTTTAVGTYNWIATYNGDANNNPLSTNSGYQAVTVGPASPSIPSAATPARAPVGSPIHDTATVSGGSNPTGTVTFKLFGPTDPTCAGASLVSGAGFVNV